MIEAVGVVLPVCNEALLLPACLAALETALAALPRRIRRLIVIAVHGANLAVRADAYLAVGGFAPLRSGEDHALWYALHAAARPCVATRAIEVVTSARRRGRAPGGFSKFLRDLVHR